MIDYTKDRLAIVDNPYQFQHVYKRTLCVCKAGLLRSPTVAWVLSNPPYNRNTRAAGSHIEYALVSVDEVLLAWADEVVFLKEENFLEVTSKYPILRTRGNVYVLDLPDQFSYRELALLELIPAALKKAGFPE